jgi:hypothetical protein
VPRLRLRLRTTGDLVSAADQTRDMLARLRRHYIRPGQPFAGGVLIEECGWNGGAQTSRCDALYVGFTGSSGRQLIGHEVKVSRADWRRELDKPGKADAWADQCHGWYVVAPSTTIVPPAEIPEGWGLLVPNARTSTRMDVVVKAIVHTDRQPSWTACRSLIARLDTLQAVARSEVEQRVRRETEKAANEWAEQRVEMLLRDRAPDAARELLLEFEHATGRTFVNDRSFARYDAQHLRPSDLARVVAMLPQLEDVADAIRTLTGRYLGSTDSIRAACDHLDRALAAVTTTAKPQGATA